MSNKKITAFEYNDNPTFSDVFPIVNNGETKQMTLSGLTDFISIVNPPLTGGTFNNNTGITTFINSNGGLIEISGFSTSSAAWYAENETPPETLPIASGTSSIAFGEGAQALSNDMFVFGHQAGYQTINTNNSNFLGYQAGWNATNAYYSNFIGIGAGYSAENASSSNFLGANSGFQAIAANDSNFLGENAGNSATNANNSNFLGDTAGYLARNASNSNFFGSEAGRNATNANNSNFMGFNAGYKASGASNSNFLGFQAGSGATNGQYSNFLGQYSGQDAINAYGSNFLGYQAGKDAINAYDSNFMGSSAGYNATGASYSNFMGSQAGYKASGASYSNFMGSQAGYLATNASKSNLFGYKAGLSYPSNNIGSNNIIIGTNISLPNATANCINIGGVLFGSGTYSAESINPSITGQANGRIGINVVNPTANLHIGASTSLSALMKLEVGPAPDSPNDGDIWLQSNNLTGLKIRINGVTRTITIS